MADIEPTIGATLNWKRVFRLYKKGFSESKSAHLVPIGDQYETQDAAFDFVSGYGALFSQERDTATNETLPTVTLFKLRFPSEQGCEFTRRRELH